MRPWLAFLLAAVATVGEARADEAPATTDVVPYVARVELAHPLAQVRDVVGDLSVWPALAPAMLGPGAPRIEVDVSRLHAEGDSESIRATGTTDGVTLDILVTLKASAKGTLAECRLLYIRDRKLGREVIQEQESALAVAFLSNLEARLEPALAPVRARPRTIIKAPGESCKKDDECNTRSCRDGSCVETAEILRWWLGGGGDFAFVALTSATNVCPGKVGGGLHGYFCTYDDPRLGTRDFPQDATENDSIRPGYGGSVNGGLTPANGHVWASFDVALSDNVMIGVRLGYSSSGYAGTAAASMPFHGEARFTYFFLKNVLRDTKEGIVAPYAFVGVGASSTAAKVRIGVGEDVSGASQTKSVDAWVISGPALLDLGGGIRFKLGTPHAALLVGPKLALTLGKTTLFSIAPEAALQFGF